LLLQNLRQRNGREINVMQYHKVLGSLSASRLAAAKPAAKKRQRNKCHATPQSARFTNNFCYANFEKFN